MFVFNDLHMSTHKQTLPSFLQLSEPRRLGQQLEEENFLLQNADHVLRHALQDVIRQHDSSANEKNEVWI